MRAEGHDIISLSVGEPDFPTPKKICDAAKRALDEGYTKYTPTPGYNDLREVIADYLHRQNKVSASASNIVVSSGAKQALYNTAQVLLDPGDEVLIVTPCWMTYIEQVCLAGAKPVFIAAHESNGFIPSIDDLKKALTAKTKAIILNSPSNPTGAVLPRQTLKEVAALAIRHNLWVISDEIYERLVYGVEHVSIASLGKEIASRTITINGCSKTYAMTGWRLGFACAPSHIATALSNLQDQITSNSNSIAQRAAITAFQLPDEDVEAFRNIFETRRDLMLQLLGEIPHLSTCKPDGAFYLMPCVEQYYSEQYPDDCAIAAYLLDRAKVAVVPGSVFEGPGYIRLSYAASEDNIRKAAARIGDALGQLRA